jgi:hypothetical protein
LACFTICITLPAEKDTVPVTSGSHTVHQGQVDTARDVIRHAMNPGFF